MAAQPPISKWPNRTVYSRSSCRTSRTGSPANAFGRDAEFDEMAKAASHGVARRGGGGAIMGDASTTAPRNGVVNGRRRPSAPPRGGRLFSLTRAIAPPVCCAFAPSFPRPSTSFPRRREPSPHWTRRSLVSPIPRRHVIPAKAGTYWMSSFPRRREPSPHWTGRSLVSPNPQAPRHSRESGNLLDVVIPA